MDLSLIIYFLARYLRKVRRFFMLSKSEQVRVAKRKRAMEKDLQAQGFSRSHALALVRERFGANK